ncbi:DMT family transporter [Clostridium beijerinckii]|jgi:Membrane transporters of cations and cationic drugs|uniref:Small multidrug resistance protein n=1 Tax=Clostridium beijerinckii (strain ATCC 51743 / NCIMB 8052) TaxID=290402 RepID=A6LQ62_CLOB8|nr:multidrug efflux SMR transporter [Clostridium beijerinckii]ABR32492.1 small multidrug resistance protein [Clostridium beijerinckii NCIMB 8052]AIU03858.1 small multidrug resistance protein [Clostridium beijerinckii ATCC 35702]NRT26278.1 small multidrug resistance pump [Clostridium beijerinckii]NRT66116.1 small multidrug resistance pump [Clostridium beijerinckii]NRT82375.1 small multidrug resistance pump [Clostridium beijerinckii]
MISWIYLIFAIIFEVSGTISMKLSEGFTNIKYAIVMLGFYILSLSMLTLALKKVQIGVAYATWSGIGIILLSAIGIVFFKESINLQKTVFIGLIIIGVIGLNLTSTIH